MTDFLSPAALTEAFGVVIPARYRTFLEKERGSYTGRRAPIPTYENALAVHFVGSQLESFVDPDWDDDDDEDGEPIDRHPAATEVEFADHPGIVPFATLGSEEAQFLVIDLGKPSLPVLMFEHETASFEPVSASLEAFLASFEPAKSKKPAANKPAKKPAAKKPAAKKPAPAKKAKKKQGKKARK